jgi:hypothetical protein
MIDELPQPEEESIALDAHVTKLKKLAECSEHIKFWKTEYEKVKAELEAVMGTATVGTFDGSPVLTFRYEDRFRGADFKRVYPDTYRTFVTEVTEKKFNVALFKASRPDLYDEFRVRAMKSTFEI